MRRLAWCAAIVVLAASCGGGGETTSVPSPSTTATVEQPASTVTSSSTSTTTSTTVTTTTAAAVRWSVAEFGSNPTEALGSSAALGSGCSPGTGGLPDGVWFGWLDGLDGDTIEFDLACLWPGRLEPAASNDAARIRVVDVAADARVYLADRPAGYAAWAAGGTSALTAAANAPGLPDTLPFWVFVNDGVVTELAQYPQPIQWARTAGAWPALMPGCCDGGTVAPASPAGPWPATGWPADGFYSATVQHVSASQLDLELRHWFSCRDRPELCPPWWTGDEVSEDPDEPALARTVALDEHLTVVVLPILDDTPIVGDGRALGALLGDVDSVRSDFAGYRDTLTADEWRQRAADPTFPFGLADPSSTAVIDLIGYRGPGGASLMMPWSDEALVGSTWWPAVEIRGGQPILYLHAGLFAG